MIAVVAIVVIGPKELPRALRTIGRWVAKARSLTREFQSNIDDMIVQSEIEELKKTATTMGNFNTDNIIENTTASAVNTAETGTSASVNTENPDEVGNAVPLDSGFTSDNDALLQLETERKVLANQHAETNKGQQNLTDEKIVSKATET